MTDDDFLAQYPSAESGLLFYVKGIDVVRLYRMVGDFEAMRSWATALNTHPSAILPDGRELVRRARLNHNLGLCIPWMSLYARTPGGIGQKKYLPKDR